MSILENKYKFPILFTYNKIKKDLKNEKLIIFSLLSLILFRFNNDLENISFM